MGGTEIEQLKRASGHNAVIADRSGQKIGQEEGDDDYDVSQTPRVRAVWKLSRPNGRGRTIGSAISAKS